MFKRSKKGDFKGFGVFHLSQRKEIKNCQMNYSNVKNFKTIQKNEKEDISKTGKLERVSIYFKRSVKLHSSTLLYTAFNCMKLTLAILKIF